MNDDKRAQALNEQARTNQKNEGERDLGNHQNAPQTMTRWAGSGSPSALFQSVTNVCVRMQPGGSNPGENAAGEGYGQCEQKCVGIEAYGIPTGDKSRNFRRHVTHNQ